VLNIGSKNWKKISKYLKTRTPVQCLHRWTKILRPGLVKGPWTIEEDKQLLNWIKINGPCKWSKCSIIIQGRSGKQCRERWFNTLNPNVKKGNWCQEEDYQIFLLFERFGSKWSKISSFFEGRTENSIKNRFYSTLRRIHADNNRDLLTKEGYPSCNYDDKQNLLEKDKIIEDIHNSISSEFIDEEESKNSNLEKIQNKNTKKLEKENYSKNLDSKEELYINNINNNNSKITSHQIGQEELLKYFPTALKEKKEIYDEYIKSKENIIGKNSEINNKIRIEDLIEEKFSEKNAFRNHNKSLLLKSENEKNENIVFEILKKQQFSNNNDIKLINKKTKDFNETLFNNNNQFFEPEKNRQSIKPYYNSNFKTINQNLDLSTNNNDIDFSSNITSRNISSNSIKTLNFSQEKLNIIKDNNISNPQMNFINKNQEIFNPHFFISNNNNESRNFLENINMSNKIENNLKRNSSKYLFPNLPEKCNLNEEIRMNNNILNNNIFYQNEPNFDIDNITSEKDFKQMNLKCNNNLLNIKQHNNHNNTRNFNSNFYNQFYNSLYDDIHNIEKLLTQTKTEIKNFEMVKNDILPLLNSKSQRNLNVFNSIHSNNNQTNILLKNFNYDKIDNNNQIISKTKNIDGKFNPQKDMF